MLRENATFFQKNPLNRFKGTYSRFSRRLCSAS